MSIWYTWSRLHDLHARLESRVRWTCEILSPPLTVWWVSYGASRHGPVIGLFEGLTEDPQETYLTFIRGGIVELCEVQQRRRSDLQRGRGLLKRSEDQYFTCGVATCTEAERMCKKQKAMRHGEWGMGDALHLDFILDDTVVSI